jgi:hypothetical protein
MPRTGRTHVPNCGRRRLSPQVPSSRAQTMSRFLAARFAAMLAWALLLVGGFSLSNALGDHIGSDFMCWLVGVLTLAAWIWLGYAIQRRILAGLDPQGELRRQGRSRRRRRGAVTDPFDCTRQAERRFPAPGVCRLGVLRNWDSRNGVSPRLSLRSAAAVVDLERQWLAGLRPPRRLPSLSR